MKKGMSSHQSAAAETVSWITPKFILDALGPFDLDPCSCKTQPWLCAAENWTLPERDGLRDAWHGSVFLNPPYGLECALWLKKLSEHGDGVALVFARTETRMFQDWVFGKAAGLFFFAGRLHFHYPDGRRAVANAGAPSVLIAYGASALQRLQTSGLPGVCVVL